MTRVVTATYRLQLRREFPLAAARALVPYVGKLGVSHLYLSPILAARPGSSHGYDVIDPARLNPELGTEDELRALASDLHASGMGIVLDIVPNHMAATEHNPYWDNVLERGRESRFAHWFDVDWDAPRTRHRIVLPVLADTLDAVLDRGELKLRVRDSGARLAYFDRTFPLDPATLPREVQLAQWDPAGREAVDEWVAGSGGRERLRALLAAQHYRLTFWRRVADITYRRFFDVNDLVAVRVEDESVFDATHRLILEWVRDGVIDGLRVDHVDGLRDPAAYLARLRDRVEAVRPAGAPARFPIFVEKILSGDERLSTSWPVDGTTGYDFMTDVEDVFLDPRGYAGLEAMYRALRHDPGLRFEAIAHEGKRRALKGPLAADVARVARVARAWRGAAGIGTQELSDAIVELIVHLRVYRTYVVAPGVIEDADRAVLSDAFARARAIRAELARGLGALEQAFVAPPDPSDTVRGELVARIQQTSGPATAKGVEDTALYVYVPLASRNEVGGEPDRALENAHERLHQRNAQRARDWPRTLVATDTHDTKRSADLRARLDALTTIPQDWARHVRRWRRLNRPRRQVVRGKLTPDTNAEYLFYQTVFGLWPAPRPQRRADDLPSREWLDATRQRLVEYMRKAAREAKTRTSWTERDPQYEKALTDFVSRTITPADDAHFLPDIARLTAVSANAGLQLALARVLLQFAAPGIPDIYQGSELWSFTLVDPDNRRPVDFGLRARLLDEVTGDSAKIDEMLAQNLSDHRTKLALVARLLRARLEHPALFLEGDYTPLTVRSEVPVFAFSRRWEEERCICVARTRAMPGGAGSVPSRGTVVVPGDVDGPWMSLLSSRVIELGRNWAPGGSKEISLETLLPGRLTGDLFLRHRG